VQSAVWCGEVCSLQFDVERYAVCRFVLRLAKSEEGQKYLEFLHHGS
jgi:hypothetical protein